MDAKEMTTIEEKTRQIVETLSSLESELLLERQANEDLAAERERLKRVSGSIDRAAKGLRETTNLLKKSTFSQEIDAIDTGLVDLSQACKAFDERIDALASLDDRLSERIAALESLKANMESILDAKMAEAQPKHSDAMAQITSRMDLVMTVFMSCNTMP